MFLVLINTFFCIKYQVVVVSSPAWFNADCLNERKRHILSFITLSAPGPHAFLLCVSLKEPSNGEAQALDVLDQLFGPAAVSQHTIILFTHTVELEEDESLEDYLSTWRKDVQELVRRCGDRYHILEPHSGVAEDAICELVEKVEELMKEKGKQHFSCPLYQEVEKRMRDRQVKIIKERRLVTSPEDELAEAELEAVREEVEQIMDFESLGVLGILPSAKISPAPSTASFFWRCWEKLTGWIRWLPTLIRREALLGALVGLFVGGPLGGMMGTTVGSVATEVKRRRTQKMK